MEKLKGQKEAQILEVATLHRVLDSGLVSDWSVAVDGGAHVGTWTVVMATRFRKVIAFEPTAESFAYLKENTEGLENVELRREALLDKAAQVAVIKPKPNLKTLTARYCVESAHGDVRAVTLDSLGLKGCGLIKLDLEGAEWSAIAGAVRTIASFKPVIVAEISKLSERRGIEAEAVHGRIIGLGYREAFRAGVDRVYVGK